MANRGERAAATMRARMTEEIRADDEPETDEHDDIEVIAEPEAEEPSADYSHLEDEAEPAATAETEAEPDALDDLKRQLDELRGENTALKTRQVDAELASLQADHATVVMGLAAAQQAAQKAEADYATAAEKGDWKAAAVAQRAIADAAADIREMSGLRDEIKAAMSRPKAPARQQQQQAAPADPFEAQISTFTPASADWCRRNKADLTKSPLRQQKAALAHAEALSEGLAQDTPEYFEFLNNAMGYGTVKETKAAPARQPAGKTTPAARKPAGRPQVAAPSGSASPAARGAVTEVRLSAAEMATARAMGMSVKAYAARKKELIENGKDSSRTGPRYSAQSHHVR